MLHRETKWSADQEAENIGRSIMARLTTAKILTRRIDKWFHLTYIGGNWASRHSRHSPSIAIVDRLFVQAKHDNLRGDGGWYISPPKSTGLCFRYNSIEDQTIDSKWPFNPLYRLCRYAEFVTDDNCYYMLLLLYWYYLLLLICYYCLLVLFSSFSDCVTYHTFT